MSYTIEATGLDGWMAYRYQYKAGVHDYFGYAESEGEALANIKLEEEKANYREARARGEEVWNTWSYICTRCDSAIEITSNTEPVQTPTCTCSKSRKGIILISAGKAGKI
jgi:hypothetical protein